MGLTSIPTLADGSLGREKSDLAAVPDLAHYVPASEYNAMRTAVKGVCDEVGLNSGGTPGSLVARVTTLETAIGSGISVLWRMSESDPAAQFTRVTGDASLANGTFPAAPGRVSLAMTGSVANVRSIWTVNSLVLPKRYVVFARLGPGVNGQSSAGVVSYYDTTARWIVIEEYGGVIVARRNNNSAIETRGGTENVYEHATRGSHVAFTVDGKLPTAGTDPAWSMKLGGPESHRTTGDEVYYDDEFSGSWNAAWRVDGGADGFGIALNVFAGATGLPHTRHITDLMVLKHPMDQ